MKSIILDDRCLILIPCNKIITRKYAAHSDDADENIADSCRYMVGMCVSNECEQMVFATFSMVTMYVNGYVYCVCLCVCVERAFVTRSLIGFKFELNWPEDIF